MKLLFRPEAEEVLFEMAEWIEQQNTADSGLRFIDRFIDRIESFAYENVTYATCKNPVLASKELQCISIDRWIIAFKTEKKNFVVHFILWGPGLG